MRASFSGLVLPKWSMTNKQKNCDTVSCLMKIISPKWTMASLLSFSRGHSADVARFLGEFDGLTMTCFEWAGWRSASPAFLFMSRNAWRAMTTTPLSHRLPFWGLAGWGGGGGRGTWMRYRLCRLGLVRPCRAAFHLVAHFKPFAPRCHTFNL